MFSSKSATRWCFQAKVHRRWGRKKQVEATFLQTEEHSAKACDTHALLPSNARQAAVAWRRRSVPTEGIKGTDNRKSSGELSLNVNIWSPRCCHSRRLNVFTSWLSRAGLLWKEGAVGRWEDEKRGAFLLNLISYSFIFQLRAILL